MEKSFEERVAEAKAAVPAISPEAARERKEQDPNTLFLDPRDAADARSSTGVIPGAINLPLAELTEKAAGDLPQDLASTSRPIIASCGGGPMGAIAAHELKKKGFSNVSFIDGGTKGWVGAGFPTDK
jgi:rhodanese-related sulfurtransferase